jgi:UDP-glucose 4-epimerase
MKKALVTGGAGFIGSNLVDTLIRKGIEVWVLDDLSTGNIKNINSKCKFIQVDLSCLENLLSIQSQIPVVDVVFHLAAYPEVQHSLDNPTETNNITTTLNILELCRLKKINRLVFSSSSAVYGNPRYTPIDESHPIQPMSPYALDKKIGEDYCHLYSKIYGVETVCLRYFNVYGKRMKNEGAYKSVISVFKEAHFKGDLLNIVNDGEQKRDYINVKDIVNANIRVGNSTTPMKGEIYNVGTGIIYSVNEVADMFGDEKKYGEKRLEPNLSLADNRKIKKLMGWEPTYDLKKWIAKLKTQSKILI